MPKKTGVDAIIGFLSIALGTVAAVRGLGDMLDTVGDGGVWFTPVLVLLVLFAFLPLWVWFSEHVLQREAWWPGIIEAAFNPSDSRLRTWQRRAVIIGLTAFLGAAVVPVTIFAVSALRTMLSCDSCDGADYGMVGLFATVVMLFFAAWMYMVARFIIPPMLSETWRQAWLNGLRSRHLGFGAATIAVGAIFVWAAIFVVQGFLWDIWFLPSILLVGVGGLGYLLWLIVKNWARPKSPGGHEASSIPAQTTAPASKRRRKRDVTSGA